MTPVNTKESVHISTAFVAISSVPTVPKLEPIVASTAKQILWNNLDSRDSVERKTACERTANTGSEIHRISIACNLVVITPLLVYLVLSSMQINIKETRLH